MDVKHYLGIYKTRLQMQEDGITNPSSEIKALTRTIVEKLSKLPLDDKLIHENNSLKDKHGNLIVNFPKPMDFNIQPTLENEQIILYPLQESDFEELYTVASDPKVWEQHPNKDRWKREIFQNFFNGAMQSKGAFKITDKLTGKAIGCTRYYDYNEAENFILIGYTFYGTAYWGKGINPQVKKLMLDYIFQFVPRVHFHVGSNNLRSQIAVGRIGAEKIGEEEIAYFGEAPKLNFIYEIKREIG